MQDKIPDKPIIETENQKNDFDKFFVATPDSNFDARRNKQVIEESIKKADLIRAKKRKQKQEEMGERIDAIVSYLFSDKNVSMDIDTYLGPKVAARLRAERLVQRLKVANSGQQIVTFDDPSTPTNSTFII